MKRKKQKTTTGSSAAATLTANSTAGDHKALVQAHSDFFDKLIELIPAKFYLPPNDDVSDNPKPYFHGLSKAAKASLKRQSRQNLKLARRNRHDPEKISHSSTLDLLRQSLDTNAEIPPPDDDDGEAVTPRNIGLEEKDVRGGDDDGEKGGEKQVTYEELREKLRKKIESLRGNRGEGIRNARKGREDNKDRDNQRGGKRRRDGEGSSGKGIDSGTDGEEIIEYGKVKIGDDETGGKKGNKKRKMSKFKELDRAKRLKEVKKENPRVAEKEWWRAAEKRAMGVKVHDDPSLLKSSIKKEKKRKEKNVEKWKERVESQAKAKDERQQKRKENIEGRIRDKKNRKIAKREKKLMRPGFEGRKDEYITKD